VAEFKEKPDEKRPWPTWKKAICDLIVVDERDTLLICPKNEAQRVKEVVAALKEAGDPRADLHLPVSAPACPWLCEGINRV